VTLLSPAGHAWRGRFSMPARQFPASEPRGKAE
jgi:hypothetical protein